MEVGTSDNEPLELPLLLPMRAGGAEASFLRLLTAVAAEVERSPLRLCGTAAASVGDDFVPPLLSVTDLFADNTLAFRCEVSEEADVDDA